MTLEQLRKKWEKGLEVIRVYPIDLGRLIVVLKDKEGHLQVHRYSERRNKSYVTWKISVDAKCGRND